MNLNLVFIRVIIYQIIALFSFPHQISECAAKLGECDESKGRPVCGTDDQTYPTRCHLLRVQCSGHQVSIKYRGPCKGN